MTYKEYIIQIINLLVKKFPSIKIRYEDHFISNTQIVEIVPSNFYWENEEFQGIEHEVILEFITRFPEQTLGFITDDSLVGLSKIDYEKAGIEYDDYLAYAEKINFFETIAVVSECHASFQTISFGLNLIVDNAIEPLGEHNYKYAA